MSLIANLACVYERVNLIVYNNVRNLTAENARISVRV